MRWHGHLTTINPPLPPYPVHHAHLHWLPLKRYASGRNPADGGCSARATDIVFKTGACACGAVTCHIRVTRDPLATAVEGGGADSHHHAQAAAAASAPALDAETRHVSARTGMGHAQARSHLNAAVVSATLSIQCVRCCSCCCLLCALPKRRE